MKRPERVAASLVSPAVQLVESVLLFLVPHGGQRTARHNAWSQVVANKQAGVDRDEIGRYSRPLQLVSSTGS
jgi:hypothetical protein